MISKKNLKVVVFIFACAASSHIQAVPALFPLWATLTALSEKKTIKNTPVISSIAQHENVKPVVEEGMIPAWTAATAITGSGMLAEKLLDKSNEGVATQYTDKASAFPFLAGFAIAHGALSTEPVKNRLPSWMTGFWAKKIVGVATGAAFVWAKTKMSK